jgi:lipid-binding SYLF domain-containing protein
MALVAALALPALASSDKNDDLSRINRATEVFQQIMATPDKSVPQELLESAKCIGIIPGEKKFALGVGGNYGKGLVTCRTANGWSAPLFISVGGGSFGFQIGGQSTDIVMIFRNRSGVDSLLSDKFKVGADATAAAGPVGRHAGADTDVKLNAEILTYSRSKGAFAGISLDGAVVQPDESGNTAMYGEKYGNSENRRAILNGKIPVPKDAQPLVREIAQYANATGAAAKPSPKK